VQSPSQPPRFLSKDAEELGANEAGQLVRKSMEDADNSVSRVILPLPGVAASAWGGAHWQISERTMVTASLCGPFNKHRISQLGRKGSCRMCV
jgi:hypothetical protein